MKFKYWLVAGLLASNTAFSLDIYPQVSATIIKIKSIGEPVSKGDVVVQFDNRQAKLKLQHLQTLQQIKQQAFDDAQLELKQTQELYERMVASHRDLDKAQMQFNENKRELDAHNITIKIQEIELEKYTIISPITGTIEAVPNMRNATNHFSAKPLLTIQ